MLACLPASGDPTTQLLSHTQMNTGLQKWETTQKMRSVKYPTPAELDAYAKKIANNPLTIKIFPNSVKVPQRKHIRRTVNGLDTSTSGQRHSPYQSQVSAKAGLLAVLRVPAKSIVKGADGSRAPLLSKSTMNPHNSGQYITQSTLNLSQAVPHLQGLSQPQAQTLAAQKQGLPHPQAFQQQRTMARPMTSQQPQTMPHHPATHQRNMAHPQALQRQQSLSQLQTLQQQQQGLAPLQSIQRQQSLPHTQTLQKQQSQPQPQPLQQQQHLAHPQTLQQQTLPHQQALLQQHGLAQGMRHMSDAAQQLSLQNSQVLPPSQVLPQATGGGPPPTPNAPLQQLPSQGPYGPRKLPDADAPPNVTVSTSTIPLSMAASLHQNRPSDLSSIVLQINQFCQARAGMGGTSVCEGQIANPSPISRNLLISASSRVSTHNPALGPLPSCLLGGLQDTAPPQASAGAVVPQPNMAAINRMPAFHSDIEQQQLQQHQLQQQQQLQQHQLQQQQQHQQQLQQQLLQQQQQRSWNQHQLAHMQQPPEGVHPCKNPRMEALTGPGFPTKNLNYPHKLCASQSFPLRHPADKPTSSPSVKGPDMPFTNGQFMQPPWGGVLPGPNNNGSGPQEHPLSFQGGHGGTSLDCTPGPQYRGAPPAQSKLMQNVEHLGGEFQAPCFREQNLGAIGKMHRPTMGRAPEPSNGRNVHPHHPGYR